MKNDLIHYKFHIINCTVYLLPATRSCLHRLYPRYKSICFLAARWYTNDATTLSSRLTLMADDYAFVLRGYTNYRLVMSGEIVGNLLITMLVWQINSTLALISIIDTIMSTNTNLFIYHYAFLKDTLFSFYFSFLLFRWIFVTPFLYRYD